MGALFAGIDKWRTVSANPGKYTEFLKMIGERNDWKLHKQKTIRTRFISASPTVIPEIDQISAHSYDSAVFEVATTPGHLGRMSLLRRAAFRRNSGCR